MLRLVLRGAALLGLALGIETLIVHLRMDPLVDTRRFYEAGARLNEGLPLYGWTAAGLGTGSTAGASLDTLVYLNPPLLAILFRPLALLPFPAAAVVWEAVLLAATGLALRRLGLREPVLIAFGCLALPLVWALVVGQSEPLVLALLSWGSPVGVALAGQLKLVPLLVAVFWIVRRDWPALSRCVAWTAGFGVAQLALAPGDTVEYLRLGWLQGALDWNTISPYRIHPAIWAMLATGLLVAAIRLGRGRWGWAAAVAFGVLVHPRLLVYQLVTLLAAFGGPARETPA
jgi:Glycosyltransferase family 87